MRGLVVAWLTLVILVYVVFGLWLSIIAHERPINKLEHMVSPYERATQTDTLLKVLTLMGQTYSPGILLPEIRNAARVPQSEYTKAIGFETNGKFCPLYDPLTNIIYLLDDSQVHTLAHEYAHYVQVQYKKADLNMYLMDEYEGEAITIQNYFRN